MPETTKLKRTILASIITLTIAAMTHSAAGSEAVRCVQSELTALGHDPGPIDGDMGRRTASAFATLSSAASNELAAFGVTPLDNDNASSWCRDLATAFPELVPVYEQYRQAVEDETRVSGFRYDIAADVPAERVGEIQEGFRLVRDFISEELGGDIPAATRESITVKIVATGRGNQERGGGGGVATALAEGHPVARLFFDVAHPEWSQDTRGRGWTTATDNTKVGAHEYTHAWQASLGGLTIHKQELGNWMNEGIAEYVAYRAMEKAGLLKWEDAAAFMVRGALGPETDHPLDAFGTTQSPAWAGHVGFLAIDWLVSESPGGLMALRTAATEVKKGRSQKQAFQTAFGIELKDFYEQFETWRQVLVANPDQAMSMRPKLRIGGVAEAADLVREAPAFANAQDAAANLVDVAGRPMQLPEDTELTGDRLAAIVVGRDVTIRYPQGRQGVMTFGTDGAYRFVFDGAMRVIGTYAVSSDGWICSSVANRKESCVKYVMSGAVLYRLNPVDGRMPVEVK